MGTVLIVASGKGGTGKTSFCAGVSAALCALSEKVLLIDADAGLKSQDLVLGMSDSLLFSYYDVIKNGAMLKDAAIKHPQVKNLRVLTAPLKFKDGNMLTPREIEKLLTLAMEHFSYVLVDCPAGLSDSIVSFAKAADRTIIISTADHIALRSAQKIAEIFSKNGVENNKIVVNRVKRSMIVKGASINIDQAMDTAGLSLLGVVPEDGDVALNANLGKVLMLESAGPASIAYLNIARRIKGERVPILENIKKRF